MLINGSILAGEKYVAQIYEIKIYHVVWIKNEVGLMFVVQPDTRILVTGLPDPVDIFRKCLNIILVLKNV